MTSKVYQKRTPPLHNGRMNNVLLRVDGGILGGEVWIGWLDVGMQGRCGGRCWPVFRKKRMKKKKELEPSSLVELKKKKERETQFRWNISCCISTQDKRGGAFVLIWWSVDQ